MNLFHLLLRQHICNLLQCLIAFTFDGQIFICSFCSVILSLYQDQVRDSKDVKESLGDKDDSQSGSNSINFICALFNYLCAHAYSLKIRMHLHIAQANWSLSNVHNVHNFHFVFPMSPLIYQYEMKKCLAFLKIKE